MLAKCQMLCYSIQVGKRKMLSIRKYGRLVKGLRRRPLTAETGVRFPYLLRLIEWQKPVKRFLPFLFSVLDFAIIRKSVCFAQIEPQEENKMELSKMLAMVDHTLLKPEATWTQIRQICDDAMKYHTATVCIPASYVARCKAYMQDRADKVGVCTVIGFPTGYSTTAAKVFEAADAVKNGADEVDMVINIGMLKDGRDDEVLAEINAIKAACAGHPLKVIIETCLLTEEEKIRMCDIVSQSDADFIKTSTGFSTAGATFDDVALMKAHMKPGKGIKAAGGIASLDDAYKFIELGATRLGTSRIVKLVKNEEATGY